MSLALHPRAAGPGKVRVWLGLTGEAAPEAPHWSIEPVGNAPAPPAVPPAALRELAPVRSLELAPDDPPRVCSGLYEFTGLQPGAAYEVTAFWLGGESATIRVRSLPEALPEGPEEWFNILLVSCFHYFEAAPQAVENAIAQARNDCRGYGGHDKEIHLSLLMGDQVYLDLPTFKDFPNRREWLAEKFENDYRRNWFGEPAATRASKQAPTGYAAVLAAAPSVCLPDDHEYWNNFPHASPFIGNSWSRAGREHWRDAARAMFEGFQLHEPTALGGLVELHLPPLSLCVADSRTFRGEKYQADPNLPEFANSLTPEALAGIGNWVQRTNAGGGFGLFVTGQSLLAPPASGLGKRTADAELANYDDFQSLMRALTRLEKPALYVTGDVHWGRLVELADPTRRGVTTAFEIITSPCALVTTVGSDDLARGWSAVKGLFGAKDPWPRHGKGEPAAEVLKHLPGPFLKPTTHHRQRGDQVAVLSLQRLGEGGTQWINARLGFYPIHPDPQVCQRSRHEFTFALRPTS